MPPTLHTHDDDDQAIAFNVHTLLDHLEAMHGLDPRDSATMFLDKSPEQVNARHQSEHSAMALQALAEAQADDPGPRVAPTAHAPDKKAHSHEGHWPTAEEARFHLVYAHGWDPVRASSLYLPDAELSHHDEHTRIDRPLADRLRKADTHPVNVIAHMATGGFEDSAETSHRQRVLSQYQADVIEHLRDVEKTHHGVWVLLDEDGIDVVAADLREIEEMRNDDQYLGAHQLAANIDKLLGITP